MLVVYEKSWDLSSLEKNIKEFFKFFIKQVRREANNSRNMLGTLRTLGGTRDNDMRNNSASTISDPYAHWGK